MMYLHRWETVSSEGYMGRSPRLLQDTTAAGTMGHHYPAGQSLFPLADAVPYLCSLLQLVPLSASFPVSILHILPRLSYSPYYEGVS